MPVSPWTIARRQVLRGAFTLALGGAGLRLAAADEVRSTAKLRVIETTDIHVYLMPWDYYRDLADNSFGLTRTFTLLKEARDEARNVLVLDNGDMLQGSPMGDWVAYERGLKKGELHPVIAAMNAIGYDAGTLGNHEFNYGLDFLEATLAHAKFPLVLANVAKGALKSGPRTDETLLAPWTIVTKTIVDDAGVAHPIRIGLIGFTPPQIMEWDEKNLRGRVAVRGIVETARAQVPALREAGADLVIALSHSGIAAGNDPEAENASLALARVEGIDLILTGHQHLVFPGPGFAGIEGADLAKSALFGVPAAQPGFWGSHIGVIDLDIVRDGGAWHVVGWNVANRPIYERKDGKVVPLAESDAGMTGLIAPAHEGTLAYVRRPVGEIAAPVTSYFALVSDDPSVQIVNDAQTWYARQMLAGTPWKDLPLLSAAAPFKAGGRGGPAYYTDIPAGPIAIRNVADIYVYPNTVMMVLVDGATVKEWLEMSAGQFRRIDPEGGEQALIDPRFPTYNFDVIDGVRYDIDVTQPARYDGDGKLIDTKAERIRNLTFDGKPIDKAAKFVVVTNNYRATGGGNFPGVNAEHIILRAPDLTRDAIVRYFHDKGTVNPTADGNWRILRDFGAATVTFETGPGAASVIGGRSDVAAIAQEPNGFVRYRLQG